MKYASGKAGRIFVARLEDRDDILKNLQELAKKEDIKAGVFYLLGGILQLK
ncbi:MAG: PCC domain-containing protein [Thermodesulfovibrionales bacterium]